MNFPRSKDILVASILLHTTPPPQSRDLLVSFFPILVTPNCITSFIHTDILDVDAHTYTIWDRAALPFVTRRHYESIDLPSRCVSPECGLDRRFGGR